MITTALLADVRRINEQFMPDTVSVQRRTLSADGRGGQTASYSTETTTTGRIVFVGDNPAYKAIIEGAQLQAHEIYRAAITYGTGAMVTDRLVFGSSQYEIVSALNTRSYQTAERFLVRYVGEMDLAMMSGFLLLETADFLLLETGDKLVTE
jgi:hypothetical protein